MHYMCIKIGFMALTTTSWHACMCVQFTLCFTQFLRRDFNILLNTLCARPVISHYD